MKKLTSLVLSTSLALSGCGGFLKAIDAAYNGAFDSCYDTEYDNDLRCFNETEGILEQFEDSLYQIHSHHTYASISMPTELITKTNAGTGILFEGGYFLTARHVIEAPKKSFQHHIGSISYILKENKKYYLKPILSESNKNLDYAWLKIINKNIDDLATCPIKFGNTDKLKTRNITYLFGNAVDLGKRVTQGIISRIQLDEEEKKRFGDSLIIVTNHMYHGDSGGPLIAIKDGEFQIMGINDQIIERAQINYMTSINQIVKDSLDVLSNLKPSKTRSELLNLILSLKTD